MQFASFLGTSAEFNLRVSTTFNGDSDPSSGWSDNVHGVRFTIESFFVRPALQRKQCPRTPPNTCIRPLRSCTLKT